MKLLVLVLLLAVIVSAQPSEEMRKKFEEMKEKRAGLHNEDIRRRFQRPDEREEYDKRLLFCMLKNTELSEEEASSAITNAIKPQVEASSLLHIRKVGGKRAIVRLTQPDNDGTVKKALEASGICETVDYKLRMHIMDKNRRGEL